MTLLAKIARRMYEVDNENVTMWLVSDDNSISELVPRADWYESKWNDETARYLIRARTALDVIVGCLPTQDWHVTKAAIEAARDERTKCFEGSLP